MPVILQAPYPQLQTTTVLPSPEFGDSEGQENQLTEMRSMVGTLYTYIKTTDRRKLLMDFTLDLMKTLELQAFIRSYYASTVRLIDVNGIAWIVKFTSNPFLTDYPNQRQTVRLEFQGVQE